MKFYKNIETNEIINTINEINDEKYELLIPNTSDGALEKHVPIYSINDGMIMIQVGENAHPMLNEHYIMWIALVTDNEITKINLNPSDKPEGVFEYKENSVIYAYCNIHGLWKVDVE